jgi:5,10-methylenetetrahydromethanopterin reductase
MTDTTLPALACAFPPSHDLPIYARRAEELGYERVWVFDSPALYGDIWIALARVAETTERIGLGTGVAIPSLRHVMVTASAIASVEEIAPGRLAVAFGTGFTARNTMGQRGMRWADLAEYVRQLRGLLRGDVVIVDGEACQMLHSPGFAPPRPIDVPLLVAPMGPKGYGVARDVADGVVVAVPPPDGDNWSTCAMLLGGSVLDDGEDHTSARVRDAVGPLFVTGYHAMWEWGSDAVAGLPGGPAWRARVEASRPEGEWHLAVHEGHLVAVTDRDRSLLDAGGAAILGAGLTGDRESVRARLVALAAAGVTEIMYAPAGSDIVRELEAFAGVAAPD